MKRGVTYCSELYLKCRPHILSFYYRARGNEYRPVSGTEHAHKSDENISRSTLEIMNSSQVELQEEGLHHNPDDGAPIIPSGLPILANPTATRPLPDPIVRYSPSISSSLEGSNASLNISSVTNSQEIRPPNDLELQVMVGIPIIESPTGRRHNQKQKATSFTRPPSSPSKSKRPPSRSPTRK
jgi:hypothetical protein